MRRRGFQPSRNPRERFEASKRIVVHAVTHEQLVAAVGGKRDLHFGARQARNQDRRYARRIPERLVEQGAPVARDPERFFHAENVFGVTRAQVFGHFSRPYRLIAMVFFEADRERTDRLRRRARESR